MAEVPLPFCDPTARGLRLLADAIDSGHCVVTRMAFNERSGDPNILISIAVREGKPRDEHPEEP